MARSKVTVNWDFKKINGRIDQILENYGPYISFQLQEELSKPQFEYTDDENKPVITRRKNGETVGSPRDIVDTGRLLNSQTAPDIKNGVLKIRWTAPYSKAILEGGYIVGTVRNNYVAKARDWITPALRERPFKPFVIRQWRQLSGQ